MADPDRVPAAPRARPARVLLVSINTEDQPQPVYPLALDSLRDALRRGGHEARLFDCWKAAADGASIGETLREFKPDLVGVSVRNIDNNQSVGTRVYLPDLLAALAEIRGATAAPIVLGGSGYSLFPRELLRLSGAEAGVVGPGEGVIAALADRAAAGAPLAGAPDVPGLAFRRSGKIVVNPPRQPESLAGAIARDPELAKAYWRAGGALNIQISRGCPHACVYCTYPLLEGRRRAGRPVGDAVDEIRVLHERTGADNFFIVDSVFNADPAAARSFADELIRRGPRVRWSAFFTPAGVTRADAERWKASGLEGVEFGTDALAAETLRSYGKPFGVEAAQAAAEACAAADLPYVVYLIFGGPGETRETLDETIARALALPRAVICAFAGMRIYPGTPLARRAADEGVIHEGESLLDPRFYLSPALDAGAIYQRCRELGERPNWLVVGGGIEEKGARAAALRRRGRKGSLWQLLRPAPRQE
jgi:radical SAM superfamily enzyme YgiQ (UPF0313 family)